MGQKKKFVHKNKTGQHSLNPDRERKNDSQRDKSTIKRLLMYKHCKPKRDRHGKIIKAAPFQETVKSGEVSRIEPNRRWFGNTKTIEQQKLQNFQEKLGSALNNPYQVVLRQTKLPITLLQESMKQKRMHLLDVEPFEETFTGKKNRKKPKIMTNDLEELVSAAAQANLKYEEKNDTDLVVDDDGVKDSTMFPLFKAGQSKRIWNELYKVIDSSDVLLHILDCRDPEGTRCKQVEKYLKKEKPFKHLVFVLNKCDLVPTSCTKLWIKKLSCEYPTIAFKCSTSKSFGRLALIHLLRQFTAMHPDKKQISVGLIGYPNSGKTPIAGETKVWQYISLTKKIFLIDCPGIVYPYGDTESDIILKGVIRVENVPMPENHIHVLIDRVNRKHLAATYKIDEDWKDENDFLEKIAFKTGKLLKGNRPDVRTVSMMILNDFQRGKIPYYCHPNDDNKNSWLNEKFDDDDDDELNAELYGITSKDLMKIESDTDMKEFELKKDESVSLINK
ncbi:hypothetical protein SNEBB_004568 [Seison nebaliae]|nr:hypothetical protein SNEBB_004568 [Seison nebaliae]